PVGRFGAGRGGSMRAPSRPITRGTPLDPGDLMSPNSFPPLPPPEDEEPPRWQTPDWLGTAGAPVPPSTPARPPKPAPRAAGPAPPPAHDHAPAPGARPQVRTPDPAPAPRMP